MIYNTNTAPSVSPNDLYILGQGNTSIGGQINTNITAANNILVNAGQSATFQGNFVVINSPQEIQLVGTQQLRGSASNIAIQVPSGQSAIYLSQSNGIELVTNQSMTQTALNSIGISSATVNLSGAVNINGAPYSPAVSSFDTLFVNTLSNTSGLLNVRGTNILFSSFTTQIGAVNNIELQANNEIFLQPSNSLQVDTSNVVMNANLSVSKNLNAPAITGLSSINGLPYTPGGGTTVSTFTQVNTNILSNNPAIGNDLLLRASNAIVMTTPGFTSISLGDTLEIQGSAGATNIYTQNFTSLNNLIQFTGSNMILTGQSNITATSLSSINLYSPTLLWNDAPIVRNPTQFSSLTGLGAFPAIFYSTGQNLYIGVSDDPIGNQLIMDSDGVEIISGQELRLGGRSYARLDAGGDLGSFMDIVALASININAPIINLQSVSTICSGDIRASTFNGAPLPSGGGGGSISTFQQLFTSSFVTNTINGSAYPPPSSWVSTATSDLNMATYAINNLGQITGSNFTVFTQSNLGLYSSNDTIITAGGGVDITASGSDMYFNSAGSIYTESAANLVFSNAGVTKFFTSNVYRQLYPGTEIIQPVIQRGFVSAARAATGSNTVSMPFSYYDTNYTVQITGAMNGADINGTYQPLFYVQIDSGTDFTVYWTNGSPDNDVPFFWTTFGVYDVPT